MKSLLIIVLSALFTLPAFAATAIWTGKSEQVQTVTYKWVWRCEYDYFGKKFYRLSEAFCASSIEIE